MSPSSDRASMIVPGYCYGQAEAPTPKQSSVICGMISPSGRCLHPYIRFSMASFVLPLDSALSPGVPTGLSKASSVSVARLLPTIVRKEFTDELRGQDPYVPGLWASMCLQAGKVRNMITGGAVVAPSVPSAGGQLLPTKPICRRGKEIEDIRR